MATYRELHGKAVKTVTTNPSDDAAEGQIWFNSTDNTFKSVVSLQAWSSSSPLSTARQHMASFGTQTAAVASTGSTSGSSPYGVQNLTEHYNGTGWTSATNNPLSMRLSAGTGTETSGLVFGGNALPGPAYVATTNEYDGSSWTSGGSLGSPIGIHAGLGTQTAALQASGYGRPPNPGSNTNTAEEYNGTSWTSTNTVNTARRTLSSSGIQTAGIIAGGFTTTRVANSEEYNGTSFSEGNDINTARSAYHMCGGTTESNSWICGGTTAPGPKSTATEYYDGTSWTNQTATLAAGRSGGGAGGIQNTAVVFGGQNPSITGATEELNQSAAVITAAAWASGGSLNTARTSMFTGPIGTQTAGYAAGGSTPGPRSNATEEYNGSSWTTVNTVPVSLSSRGGAGTQTAAVLFSGNPNPSTVTTTTEYDGTNYSEGGAMNNSRGYGPIASGTQTAALGGGGYNPSASPGNITVTEYYNGTAWTSQPAANPATYGGASGGTQSATWMVAGIQQPPSPTKAVVEWDGSSWTAGASYGTDHTVNLFGGGPQTAAWICGGQIYPGTGLRGFTNHYDGTVWATAPNLGTARSGACQGGTQAAGLVAGGISSLPSTRTNVTEEFTGETTSVNIETLTQS